LRRWRRTIFFEPDFCNVASGWEKGRVEKHVQDARRQIWQDAAHERFDGFAALNAWLAMRSLAAWEAPHPELTGLTIREAWAQECAHLMPMPTPFDGYVELPARVSSTSLVSVARNRYSVPCAWAGQRVSVRLYPACVVIVADHDIIAEHPRAVDRDQVSYDWQHYLPLVERKPGALRNGAPFAALPDSLQRLRRALLRHDGGDQVMARVLMAVPTHGLDAVLVAVDLVLETGRPSAEHVLNVLARLTEGPPAPSVATALTVATVPLADPQRYDALHEKEEVTHAAVWHGRLLRRGPRAGPAGDGDGHPGAGPAGARRNHGSHHALHPLPDAHRALPDPSRSRRL
jgi:hypothetical protein